VNSADIDDIDRDYWIILASEYVKALELVDKSKNDPNNFYLSVYNRRLLKRVLNRLEQLESYVC
jgi:hypothetical protein